MDISKEKIFLNEAYWRNMGCGDLENYIYTIYDYYRQEGFPYYSTDMEYRQKEFNKLVKYDRTNLFQDDVVKQTMHGLGLAWSYFPHAFDVKCGDKLTPYEAFMDDDIFLNVIRKRLKMGTYMSDSGIRKMLKIFSGVQGVSNFRPTAAAAIYDRFAKDGVVWDMSGGWGGRLLGAIISDVKHYITTEPSTKTEMGLAALRDDFGGDTSIDIFGLGSEDYVPDKNSLDLCFTSPPYFDLEKYSDESTQSYIIYPTKDDWIEGYLTETFKNCHYGLKSGAVMLINIADIKGKELEKEMIKTAEKVGFKLVKKFFLALSNINLRNKEKKFKYEPIYLFTK